MQQTRVYGMLQITTAVHDSSGCVSSIGCGAADGIHVVTVTNWSTVTYDVEIESELPQRSGRLTFSGSTPYCWTAKFWSLVKDDTEETSCEIVPTMPGRERLHCIDVKVKKGTRWSRAAGARQPLSLTVNVT